jgi:hypothetical protein
VLRHHTFQKDPYPKVLPIRDKALSKRTLDLINSYAGVFALADYYDAITSRKNNKFGGKTFTNLEVKAQMKKDKPEHAQLIETLFKKGIFGKSSAVVLRSTVCAKKRSSKAIMALNKKRKK